MKYRPKTLEAKWQKRWQKEKTYEPNLTKAKKPFYNLMMFPYPSAEGLHVGNMYAFTGSDIYGRFQRMRGHDVFEPIGLDGFGIHSENYALKIGKHPASQAKISEKRFYKQLASIGNGFSWNERLETYGPDYYRWTQWIFIQMFKRGLAYRKKAEVNWCTSCLTVLADEQVINGHCERCSSEVIKKQLEQWFFKITDYAERLLKNLDTLDWSDKVKIAQRNWIGKSTGVIIRFGDIEVFTTRPDTILGVTFIALAPTHPWAGSRKKAVHPITNAEIPVYVANYVISDYGVGAVMGVPHYDERDREFAESHKIPFGDSTILDQEEAIKKVGGVKTVRYRLRDWLISRQRYWGPPIPMIFCEKCEWQPVPENKLPVVLPKIKNFRPTGTGASPLAAVKSFYETSCPKCKGNARRETDVSDTFLDSAWYFLRYPGVKEKKVPWNEALTGRWLPVHRYIGGAEHSVLHLLYSRFLTMVFHDWGMLNFEEPFTEFRAHGLLIKEGAKMSKSKGNVINPDEYVARFGADTLRMYLMFLAPFEQGGDFRDQAVMGIHRFLNRVWNIAPALRKTTGPPKSQIVNQKSDVQKVLHQTIKKVTEDIERLHYNTAISALMVLLRDMEQQKEVPRSNLKALLQLLAPFAPHITEELWHILGEKKSIHHSSWPVWDPKMVVSETFDLVIQVNGRTRTTLPTSKTITQKEAERMALQDAVVERWLGGKKPKRVIFVPQRLINFIV